MRHSRSELAIWVGALILIFLAVTIAHGQRFTMQEVALGQAFFHDKRLSLDGTVSCATCHQPARGFSDGLPRATGILGQVGQFNTPTILTAAYHPLQFWDGRTTGIDTQALQPLTNPIEMGNATTNQALSRIAGEPVYRAALLEIYGDSRFTQARFARAITAYQLAANSQETRLDRRQAGFTRALSPKAERGYRVFLALNCASCHQPGLYTDRGFHNTGVSFLMRERDQVTGDPELGRLDVLPAGSELNSSTVRAWKTPTLRGIDRSGPYTHAGVVPDLETQVELYARAFARPDGSIDPFIDRRIIEIARARPTAQHKSDLVYFLREGFSMPNAYNFVTPYRP
jgi:cytochrome c peroxidase